MDPLTTFLSNATMQLLDSRTESRKQLAHAMPALLSVLAGEAWRRRQEPAVPPQCVQWRLSGAVAVAVAPHPTPPTQCRRPHRTNARWRGAVAACALD